jgi:ABC-type Fe3+/spermidine/putrescine transport system ATPase subunit
MVAGFMAPTAGSIEIDGSDMTRVPPYRRDVGMVFQNYALFPHMTAADNVAFPLRMRRRPSAEIKKRVADALELVKLGGYGDRYPRQLSGGQQQRVALARAVVFEPRLLLMDEPLGALDRKLRESLQLEIIRVSRELGATVLYVTHDQEEALVMSDRIAIFSAGRIEQLGSGEDLYDRPASLFVADFIGESNILRGRYEADGGDGDWVTQTDPDRRRRGSRRRAERRRSDGRRGALPRSGHQVPSGARLGAAGRCARAPRVEWSRAPARRPGPARLVGRRRAARRGSRRRITVDPPLAWYRATCE